MFPVTKQGCLNVSATRESRKQPPFRPGLNFIRTPKPPLNFQASGVPEIRKSMLDHELLRVRRPQLTQYYSTGRKIIHDEITRGGDGKELVGMATSCSQAIQKMLESDAQCRRPSDFGRDFEDLCLIRFQYATVFNVLSWLFQSPSTSPQEKTTIDKLQKEIINLNRAVKVLINTALGQENENSTPMDITIIRDFAEKWNRDWQSILENVSFLLSKECIGPLTTRLHLNPTAQNHPDFREMLGLYTDCHFAGKLLGHFQLENLPLYPSFPRMRGTPHDFLYQALKGNIPLGPVEWIRGLFPKPISNLYLTLLERREGRKLLRCGALEKSAQKLPTFRRGLPLVHGYYRELFEAYRKYFDQDRENPAFGWHPIQVQSNSALRELSTEYHWLETLGDCLKWMYFNHLHNHETLKSLEERIQQLRIQVGAYLARTITPALPLSQQQNTALGELEGNEATLLQQLRQLAREVNDICAQLC
jgi:hypothetical protein